MTDTKPRTSEPIAVFAHTDAAAQWATSEERTVVFSVTRERKTEDGEPWRDEVGELIPAPIDRIDYTMPKRPNAGLALAYLKKARENADLAMSWLLETALGEEGYDALVEELSGEEDPKRAIAIMQGVTERIQKVAMGGLDGEGNSPKA